MVVVSLLGDMSGWGIRCRGSSSRVRGVSGGSIGFGVSRGGYWHWVGRSQDGRMDEEFFKGDAFHRVFLEQFPYKILQIVTHHRRHIRHLFVSKSYYVVVFLNLFE
jgi:hypothetical protein